MLAFHESREKTDSLGQTTSHPRASHQPLQLGRSSGTLAVLGRNQQDDEMCRAVRAAMCDSASLERHPASVTHRGADSSSTRQPSTTYDCQGGARTHALRRSRAVRLGESSNSHLRIFGRDRPLKIT